MVDGRMVERKEDGDRVGCLAEGYIIDDQRGQFDRCEGISLRFGNLRSLLDWYWWLLRSKTGHVDVWR